MEDRALECRVLEHVNEPPSPTWNHLGINGISLSVPEVSCDAAVPASTGGMGSDAALWLETASGGRRIVEVAPDVDECDCIVVDLARDGGPIRALDLCMGEGSSARLVLLAGELPGDGAVPPTCGWSVHAALETGARLDVYALAAAPGWQVLDDFSATLGDDASLCVRQFYLDGELVAGGMACELAGARSRVEVDNRYLGRRSQTVDVGHVVRQCGRATVCDLAYRGILADGAVKTLRDTIDLARGCKGSRGSESETVLLAGQDVSNRSLPVILCGEDDVAGDHGATVGELGAAERAYFASRGLAPEDVPALVMESTFGAAHAAAPTESARRTVLVCAARVLGADALEDISCH